VDNIGLISQSYQDTIILDTTIPTANAGQDQTITVGTTINFDASASTDNNDIVSYEWDFGDGTTGSGVTTTHQYTQTGTYTVTLTVKDAANNSGSENLTMKIIPPDYTIYYIIGIVAVAAIIAAIYFIMMRKHS
jgi:PKD repeat protein